MEKQQSYHSQNEQQLQRKVYSLLPDLLTGWRPRNIKIPAPIIITYQSILTDIYYQHYKSLNKIVYLGQRFPNSYAFHNQIDHQYQIKYGLDNKQMPLTFQKTLETFSQAKNRFFKGMNPLMRNQLQFDSNFESGNLDMVLKIQQNEYDLFLRPDTNTCGHMQWYYFKIIKPAKYKYKSIKINILNNRKAKTLYSRGMKPYILSKKMKETQNIQWKQGGYNVNYTQLQIREQLQNVERIADEKQHIKKHWCLSFQYQFQANEDEVYFSYCPPYTYSDMKKHLQHLKKTTSGIIQEQNLCLSLSGLQIPILTITNNDVPQNQKKYVVAIGRIHPGQANGSYVIKGFMDYIVSPQAKQSLKKFIFIIIPMINPDGVVFGNYRTALCGKDLNRRFKAKSIELFPQVIQLRKYFTRLRLQKKAKFMLFLDFHGHSMKKNVFFYGPEYDIWTNKYTRSKILPKILANKTDMFRYQSCIFRVAAEKKTTARAFMLGFIPYCYTIESSTGLYRSFKNQEDEQFTVQKWQQMGKIVGESLKQMHQKLYEDPCFRKKKRKSKIFQKEDQVQDQKQKKIIKERKYRFSERKLQSRSFYDEKVASCERTIQETSKQRIQSKLQQRKSSSKKHQRNLKIIRKQYVNNLVNIEFPLIAEQQCESDKFSEGNSDCQSDDNDLNKEQYKVLSGKIMSIIDNFNKYVGLAEERKIAPYKSHRKRKLLKRKKSSQMDMVPSLKYKNMIRNSQKRIGEFLFDDIMNKIKP